MDNNSISLRRKIVSKFTPKIQVTPKKTNTEIKKPLLASIKRLLSPILAKSPKEVHKISKFFKSNKLDKLASNKPKLYAQASKQNTSIANVIKIKETFPSVSMKEINEINNIIKGPIKTKPRIQITTKCPSRK